MRSCEGCNLLTSRTPPAACVQVCSQHRNARSGGSEIVPGTDCDITNRCQKYIVVICIERCFIPNTTVTMSEHITHANSDSHQDYLGEAKAGIKMNSHRVKSSRKIIALNRVSSRRTSVVVVLLSFHFVFQQR